MAFDAAYWYAVAYYYRWYIAAGLGIVAVVALLAAYRTGWWPSFGLRQRLSRDLERVGDRVLALVPQVGGADDGFEYDDGESPEGADASDGDGEDGDGFDPNVRALATGLAIGTVVLLPLFVFFLQGAWPFGPWRGFTILGLPLYWVAFFGMLLLSIASLPVYVYFIAPTIPGLGGAIPRVTWIIASWAQGATIFDRAADGRYYARPLRKNDETEQAEMWVDGEWQEVPGNVEFVSRLAWRPIAFTWEKTDTSVEEIIATDMGEDPVDFLVERGYMDREMAEEYQPRVHGGHQPQAAADGGGPLYDQYGAPVDAVANGGTAGVPYNVLDHRGHAFQAFNPFPDGGDGDEYVIDSAKVRHKLSGAGETGLIQRAKDIALTDVAQTTRMDTVVGWMMIAGALIFGVGVAYMTV